MKLVTISPEVTETDVQFMMKRVGLTDGDIEKALGPDCILSVRPRGNYVVAMITNKAFPTALGVAKRNPIDEFNPIIGARLAMRKCFEEVKGINESNSVRKGDGA